MAGALLLGCIGAAQWLATPAPMVVATAPKVALHTQLVERPDTPTTPSAAVKTCPHKSPLPLIEAACAGGEPAPGELAAALDALTLAEFDACMDALTRRWGRRWLDSIPVADAVLARWTALDPERAMAFAASPTTQETRARAMLAVARAASPEARSLDWGRRATGFYYEERSEFFALLIADRELGADATWQRWVAALPVDVQTSAVAALGQAWIARDSESAHRAVDWLLRLESASPLAETRISEDLHTLLGEWTRRHPAQAADWALTARRGDPRAPSALGRVVAVWARADAAAAGDFVNALAPGPLRDSAAAEFAFSVAGRDRSAAAHWAQAVADPELREQTLARVASGDAQ